MIAITTGDTQAQHRPARAPRASLPVRGERGGAPPGDELVECVHPTDLAEAADAVAGAGRLLIRGGATKLDWGNPVEGVERVVDTGGLARLVRHDPADLTAVVQAGMPLAQLQAELAEAGQWLALDPPWHDHAGRAATLGGVVASGDHGPRRLAHGAARDQVIGATFVLADGTVARTGGQVIKNVAGYDLAKLLCGSMGTVALIVELTVRLQPLPSASATLAVDVDPAGAHGVALALDDAQLEPAAIDHVADLGADDGRLWVRFDGSAPVVEQHRRAAAAIAADHGLDVEWHDDPAVWEELTAGLAGGEGHTVVAVSTVPSVGARVAATAERAAAAAGVHARWHSHVPLGLHRVALAGGDAAGHAAVVHALRGRGDRAELRRRMGGVDDLVDAWTDGDLPSAWPLMRSLRTRLDPDRRLAPGRFLGGL